MNLIAAIFALSVITMASVGITLCVSPEYVYPADFQKAAEVCSANGGVEALELDIARIDVTCINGAMFDVPAAAEVQS